MNFVKGELRLSLYVQPNASKTSFAGEFDGALKLKVHAPPVEGKANEEIIRFLAKYLGIPKSRITIDKGSASRKKLVVIGGDGLEGIAGKLQLY
ncbi:MAG: YggU family protein [Bdellovibrionaceae bacterium]|nr:YggU family protein [Pseudobdellovibrionaceae bacterium]